MNINYAVIGRQIRVWRGRRNLTQERLAALIEREPAYLCRIERGNQKPSLETLLRVCQALELDINNLLSDSPGAQLPAQRREIEFLLDGCSDYEFSIILQCAVALKAILKDAMRSRKTKY